MNTEATVHEITELSRQEENIPRNWPMNEVDILKSIAENLSERKSTAALNNYEVLCNNIRYVNNLLDEGIEALDMIHGQINSAFQDDAMVTTEFMDQSKRLFHFRKIVPRILLNDISIIRKLILYTQPDDRQGISIENVSALKKTFLDFNNLVTSSRQFIDSLVSDAYQLTLLDPKTTNFQVLTSLRSFNKYATKSIKHGIFNAEVQESLVEFEGLAYNERVRGQESTITKCDKKSFGEKVDFLFDNLGLTAESDFKEEIKNLFSFSSEFTHIGYVSTFFTGSNSREVIFGDNIGPYLPSTENFSELKYEILETATKFYSKIYLPSVISSLRMAIEPSIFRTFENSMNQAITKMISDLKTRNSQYYFFIRQGLIGSNEAIDLTCMCGTIRRWQPPHDLSDIYCNNCGSKFNLLEIEGDPGYVITSSGPIKVIGSSVPDFDDLPLDKQLALLRQCEEKVKEHAKK
ncbi:hypothetical protein KKC97_00225 [bacterium]|nr:hypothetical protein [bacterium]MBU1636076.1 hypothetical protein [bacterium]